MRTEDSTDPTEPIVVDSAYRHGVSADDMLHALRFAVAHVRHDDDMVMFLGPDTSGAQLVEVGLVIWWGGELAIAHALAGDRHP